MHVSAWGCIISMRRRGGFTEGNRRCVMLPPPPGRAAHLCCCAQVSCGPAARYSTPPHPPNLRTLVYAPRCAAPPDALFAALYHHKALPHVSHRWSACRATLCSGWEQSKKSPRCSAVATDSTHRAAAHGLEIDSM